MIAANELRIGNWVKLNDQEDGKLVKFKYFSEDLRVAFFYKEAMGEFTANIAGIELSPEILERCGLKKELFEMSGCEVWHVPNTLWRVARSYRDENEYKLWHERISPPTWNLKTLKYLHELQNIIFAFTHCG